MSNGRALLPNKNRFRVKAKEEKLLKGKEGKVA